MIPVEGDSSAASQFSAGSSARAAVARKRLHAFDAVGLGVRADRLQLLGFLRRRGHDQLAAIAMRNAVIGAISVQRAPAADAHLRHQAAGAVVDPGMDHLAVARGGHRADALGLIQHDHFAAGPSQPARDRKPDHPGSDNDAINSVHVSFRSGIMPRDWAMFAPDTYHSACRSVQATRWFALRYASNARPVSEALIMSGQLP